MTIIVSAAQTDSTPLTFAIPSGSTFSSQVTVDFSALLGSTTITAAKFVSDNPMLVVLNDPAFVSGAAAATAVRNTMPAGQSATVNCTITYGTSGNGDSRIIRLVSFDNK